MADIRGTARDNFGTGSHLYAVRITAYHHMNYYPANQSIRAQYFKATDSYQVTEVRIPITGGVNQWAHGPLVVTINRATPNFAPTGFAGTSGKIAQADVASGLNIIQLDPPLTITKNNTYAIIVYFDSPLAPPSDLHSIHWVTSYDSFGQTDPYPDGQFWSKSGPFFPNWGEVLYMDALFTVYGVDIGVVLPPGPTVGFPSSRPSGYNPNFHWQPGVWAGGVYTGSFWDTSYVATGGGRWGQQLVVAGNKQIWYEELA